MKTSALADETDPALKDGVSTRTRIIPATIRDHDADRRAVAHTGRRATART